MRTARGPSAYGVRTKMVRCEVGGLRADQEDAEEPEAAERAEAPEAAELLIFSLVRPHS